MKKIGVTGGIGSGKSIVCSVFRCLGVPVYDADTRARWIMNNDGHVQEEVTRLFGKEAYDTFGLRRNFISSQTFGNPSKLTALNQIVHPAVARDFESWWLSMDVPYVIKEAALLFEAGSYRELDETILVTAPEALRKHRVARRDRQRSAEEIQRIMDSQWPESKKAALANHIIVNDQVHPILDKILNLHQHFHA
ncbi:MAG: dephospho-CoA kinase [Cyclobacteriaceae bacterium]|nr:dephospho-CoA kinase [Cyclobacteriaceae bacterium]